MSPHFTVGKLRLREPKPLACSWGRDMAELGLRPRLCDLGCVLWTPRLGTPQQSAVMTWVPLGTSRGRSSEADVRVWKAQPGPGP